MKQERHELQFPNMPRNTDENLLLAVDEKLYAELANVEANPLGELSLLGMSDVQKKRAKQLAFMLTMHTKDRALQMITNWIRNLETFSGRMGAGTQRTVSMTIILCCTAVWAQACGLDHKNKFCHSFIFGSFGLRNCFYLVVGLWSSITILLLLVHVVWSFATVTTPVLGVLVNTLQYLDTVDFVQDLETEDPQLVAERVGRNHGQSMGKNR